MAYTIKEVEKKTGISAHTLRFWAKSGLFPSIERSGAAHVRYFSESDLGWVAIVHCLRQSGLSLEAIREYVDLCFQGERTFEARLEILKNQRDETLKIMQDYQKAFDKLNAKVKYYEDEIAKRDAKNQAKAQNKANKENMQNLAQMQNNQSKKPSSTNNANDYKLKDAYNPTKKDYIGKGYFDTYQGYERMGDNAAKRIAK